MSLSSPVPPILKIPPLNLNFEGFSPEAFAALEGLRQRPTVAQYRADRERIDRAVVAPFKRYRDDLVVNWVIPNALPFETERNVFSRLLKNDFGAGGAHHHLWMSFYRPHLKRLSDVQLSHGIYPDGFAWGLYVGAYAKSLFTAARSRLLAEPEGLRLLNDVIAQGYSFSYAPTVTKKASNPTYTEPLTEMPADLQRARGIWVRRRIDREEVLAQGGSLIASAIAAQVELWPLYRWLTEAEDA